jgi:hypothetical protein
MLTTTSVEEVGPRSPTVHRRNAMKLITRFFGWIGAGLVVASIAGAFAAAGRKRTVVGGEDPEADEIRLIAVLEPISYTSRSKAFRGGTVEAWYGGGILDLREAVLDPRGARLTVQTVFGGFQVAVPAEWRVETSVKGIGGVGDGRPHIERPADAPVLTIDGIAIFGGIGITPVVTEDEARSIAEAVARRERGRQQLASVVEKARAQAAARRARTAHEGPEAAQPAA